MVSVLYNLQTAAPLACQHHPGCPTEPVTAPVTLFPYMSPQTLFLHIGNISSFSHRNLIQFCILRVELVKLRQTGQWLVVFLILKYIYSYSYPKPNPYSELLFLLNFLCALSFTQFVEKLYIDEKTLIVQRTNNFRHITGSTWFSSKYKNSTWFSS